ncbi:MAG: hypothetical protein NVS1B4_10300 [Gemmatimonadaceae bacterium]
MDHRYSGRQRITGAIETCIRTEDAQSPLVWRLDAREQLSERALSGAVFAAQRMTGTGAYFQTDVAQRLNTGKALADSVEDNRKIGHGLPTS